MKTNTIFIITKDSDKRPSVGTMLASKKNFYYYDGYKKVKEFLDDKYPGKYEELTSNMEKAYFSDELREITEIIMDDLDDLALKYDGVLYEGILDLTFASVSIPVWQAVYLSDNDNTKDGFGFYIIKNGPKKKIERVLKEIEWYFNVV